MRTKISLFIITALFISSNLLAQDVAVAKKDTSYWKTGKQFGLTFNDAGFTENFSAGGQNSWGINAFLNVKGEYARDKTTWVNDLQLQYGIINITGTGRRKSIDRIFFDTKVGRKLSKNWSLVGGFNFQTQFAEGYKYGGNPDKSDKLISNLFAPAFMTEYVGFEWKPKPFFNVVFAPGALRQTIVSDDLVREKVGTVLQPAYGVPAGQSLQNDIGIMQIVATFDKDIAKNVNLKFRYQMFMDSKRIANIDNRFDAKLTAKINKYLSTTFDIIMVYDDDQSTKLQAAHNLGIGFLYTF